MRGVNAESIRARGNNKHGGVIDKMRRVKSVNGALSQVTS